MCTEICFAGACLRSKLPRVYWLGYLPGSVFQERVSGASSFVCTGWSTYPGACFGSVFQEQAPSCVPALTQCELFKKLLLRNFYLTIHELDGQIQFKFRKSDQKSKVVKSLSRQNVNKTTLLYILNKAILKSGDGPGDGVRQGGKCKIFPRDIVSPKLRLLRLVQVPRTCCEIAHNFAANTVLIQSINLPC